MYRVLIVDDDRAVRYDLKKSKIWSAYGFTVVAEATNGQEALQKVTEEPFDLVAIDIKMPKIDGIAFLQEVRKADLDLCVIIASGYSAFEYVRQGIVLGAFDYLLKPIESTKLSEVLGRACVHLDKKYKKRDSQLKIAKQLKESLTLPHSKQDELRLFKLVTEHPDKACCYAEELAVKVSEFYSQETFKTAIILDCLLANIRQQLFHEKPWLTNLHIIKTEHKTNLQDVEDLATLIQSFVTAITDLAGFMKKLHLNHPDSVTKRLCKYVIQNIDSKLSVEIAANEFGFSSCYLGKLFRDKTGEGFVDFITTVKIEKAKILIRSGKYKNYEISEMLGYKSPDYFCSLFKTHTHMTPAEYRKSLT